ncbi:glycerate kinase [Microlunatus sagamiharensis]|uniref:Glycerate kinase n=1 Tax=Microlunatus sagamiharensis TaxID=546874 RepID=A0A1H2N5U3_9ACTN|nr:glycerate kinase [Microlunatus sagamiharensis]SDV00608.1 glycerate kinase [Microlunatus sagamiharensis]
MTTPGRSPRLTAPSGTRLAVLIAPDKFKGSLAAADVARALARGIEQVRPDLPLVQMPVADGGEGTVEAALAAGFSRVEVEVEGPTGGPLLAPYARRGRDAVVELAKAGGLDRLPDGLRAPTRASTFGVGQLLRHALEAGVERVVLGLGGSASTDGGAGMVQALGARLLDEHGCELGRGGGELARLAELDLREFVRTDHVEVVVASDVDHPLLGERGAAAVFGPQKGADAAQVRALDRALGVWATHVTRSTGVPWADEPGAGAAGGTGFAALALLGAEVRPGIDLVLDLVGFHEALLDAQLVITGEGSLDGQSLSGKAPVGVARAAGRHGAPVVVVAGRSHLTPAQAGDTGFAEVYALSEVEPDPARSMAMAASLLEQAGRRVAQAWLAPAPDR